MPEITDKKIESKESLTKIVGVVAFDGKGNVLVVRHGSDTKQKEGVYGLPAGHQEEGETPREAAARELEEETGLTALEENLLDFPNSIFEANLPLRDGQGEGEKATFNVFLATNLQGELREDLNRTKPEWVSIKDLNLIYETLPNVLEAIDNASKFINEKH